MNYEQAWNALKHKLSALETYYMGEQVSAIALAKADGIREAQKIMLTLES